MEWLIPRELHFGENGMFYPPSITTWNKQNAVLGRFFKEMSGLGSDCRGFLDMRMVLILLLLGGAGFGGFSLFSKPTPPAQPTPPAVTQTDMDQEQENAELEAKDAVLEADQQVEDMLDQASSDVGKQPGSSVDSALAIFKADVKKAQIDFRENVNSALIGLASGRPFQETMQKATTTLQADLKAAQSRFQQSLAEAVAAVGQGLESQPESRPIIFDLACDVADGVAKVENPSAKVCNRPPTSPGDHVADKGSTGDQRVSSGGGPIDGVNIRDIGREDPTTAAEGSTGDQRVSSGGGPIDGVNIRDIGREDPTTAAEGSTGDQRFSSGGGPIDGVNIRDIGREDPTTAADYGKNKPDNLLKETGQFPVTGLYTGNDLVVDGWPISCGDQPIFIAETLDQIPNTNWRPDFEIKEYSGGSYNRDGTASRDLVTIPDTVYLNRSHLQGMTTAHKLTTISRACYRGKNPKTTGNMSAFKEESCHALQKGLNEGWMTEDFAEEWCYRPASRGCNHLATACQPARWSL